MLSITGICFCVKLRLFALPVIETSTTPPFANKLLSMLFALGVDQDIILLTVSWLNTGVVTDFVGSGWVALYIVKIHRTLADVKSGSKNT